MDVGSAFRPAADGRALTGLITGLEVGGNTIAVTDGEEPSAELVVTSYPRTGPVFSGPHEVPFICETESFKLLSGETLGAPLDADCSVRTRVEYAYRSTEGGALKPLPELRAYPPDLARTTTSLGNEVPYIVRIETGTANRAIYEIAMLHDPIAEPAPDIWTRPTGWNHRLLYTFGGGCMGGWYRQGARTGGVTDDVLLRQGYAIASSTLNVFGTNCNDLLASETIMLVKERFIEAYGPPAFTIGWGCSGGSYQNLQTADNYPGLLDGIVVGCSFPDVAFGTTPFITDARLLRHYFGSNPRVPFTDEQKRAVTGFVKLETMEVVATRYASRINATEVCPDVLPEELRYHPVKNPRGARCDMYDHTGNAYGRDPATGFARRPLDNVGIQYGLTALNDGVISKEQFLDLNERIGGFDQDGNTSSARTVADPAGMRAAYETGRLTNGGGGLATAPVIDYRGYADDRPNGDVHVRYHSFSMRERLIKANGHADNHLMLVEDARYGLFSTSSPVVQEALAQMDRWLTVLMEDASDSPQIEKVRRARPADLVDACWTRDETPQKIAEQQTRGSSRCAELYPSASFPREVAGAGIASDIIKCQLKEIAPADYRVEFTAEEMARLRKIFATGVCDWSKPGVEQRGLRGTWLTFGDT